MAEIDVRGDIISNDDAWIYDWLEWDYTNPGKIKQALELKPENETLKVLINSGGGDVWAGQEIYSLLHGRDDVEIEIQSMAGSAASVIAMANHCAMSPVAMIMIHNVAMYGAGGDYHDMKKNAEILQQYNEALAEAYTEKTGMDKGEVLKLMDRETWLTANQSLELGFVDELIEPKAAVTNAISGIRLTEEIRQKVMAEKAERDRREQMKSDLLKDLERFGA